MTNERVCGSTGVEIEETDMWKLGGGSDKGVEGFGRHGGGIDGGLQGECVGWNKEIRIPGVDKAIIGRSYE